MTNDIDVTKFPRNAPKCIECGSRARLALTDVAYPDEPELHGKPLWLCECGAFSRCKAGTLIPSGRPAGPETRAARAAAFAAWKAASARVGGRLKLKPFHAGVAARSILYHDFQIGIRKDGFGWLSKDEAEQAAAAFEAVE